MTDSVLPTKFDIIVLGEGLAARLAGTLLAKSGKSVLQVRSEEPPALPAWFLSSRLYERLLEALGLEDCLGETVPVQILTPETRIEFHGRDTLAEELTREFGTQGKRVFDLLEHLRRRGEKLEEAIWECGLPLSGIGSRWRFFRSRMRHRLTSSGLKAPLRATLSRLSSPQQLEVLETLFSGLTDQPLDKLTTAEGMLVASSFGNPGGINPERFLKLLDQQFLEFQGRIIGLPRLKAVETQGQRIQSLVIAGGSSASADTYLMGDPRRLPLPAGFVSSAYQGVLPSPALTTIRPERGQLSPLMAPRVILAGEPPLRLSLHRLDATFSGSLRMRATTGEKGSENSLRQRLSEILPFVEYDLDPVLPGSVPETVSKKVKPPFPGAMSGMRLADNLLTVDAPRLLPALGSVGEAAVAVTAFRQFCR